MIGSLRRWRGRGVPQALVVAAPYLWLLLFFAIPFFFVLKISFSEARVAMPPYSDVLTFKDGVPQLQLSLGNYEFLFGDILYLTAYLSSLKIAAIATLLCLLLGYPLAYAISRCEPGTRNLLLLLVVLPSWTSFLIRIYAWIGILKNNGLLNQLLMNAGLIDAPLEILHTPAAVYIGIVYAYLPFMVLPIYANLVRLDNRLFEAAADLGAKPWQVFARVLLPLSRPGIVAGCLLVFIPAVGEFVIPELLGGPDTLMIGKVLWAEFFNNRDWPVASAVAILMLLLLLIPITYYRNAEMRELEAEQR